MTTITNKERPELLRILIGIFSAWTSFILTMTIFFGIVWLIQTKLFSIEIVGTPATITLVIALIISIYTVIKITKWQKVILDKKSLQTNYIVLVALITLTFLTLPVPMTFIIF